LQKIFNLLQDPFERAGFTSNTFWDWQLNHVGQVYGAMDDVGAFVKTFKEFSATLVPAKFHAGNHPRADARRHQGREEPGGREISVQDCAGRQRCRPAFRITAR
jgi:hypothetical protein